MSRTEVFVIALCAVVTPPVIFFAAVFFNAFAGSVI
jgi:hypothetical protein